MKVLLVQPDEIARGSLRAEVRSLAEQVEVLEAVDAVAMLSCARNHPDLALLVSELHIARAFRLLVDRADTKPASQARLVIWSAAPSHQEVAAAVELGAMAYLQMSAPRSVMRAVLQMVLAGGRYFPPDLLVGPPVGDWQAHPSVRPALTPRQAQVLRLMAAGRSNKGIARELGMSAGTVKVHVTAILKALNVRNRTEAVMAAQRGRSLRQAHYPRRLNTDC